MLLMYVRIHVCDRTAVPAYLVCPSSECAVALVCENRLLQSQLSDRGIEVETISEAQISCHSPLSILSAKSLGEAYQRLGVNTKMGLSGRQQQKMGVLSTSQVYVYEGNYYAFTPQVGLQQRTIGSMYFL